MLIAWDSLVTTGHYLVNYLGQGTLSWKGIGYFHTLSLEFGQVCTWAWPAFPVSALLFHKHSWWTSYFNALLIKKKVPRSLQSPIYHSFNKHLMSIDLGPGLVWGTEDNDENIGPRQQRACAATVRPWSRHTTAHSHLHGGPPSETQPANTARWCKLDGMAILSRMAH